MAGSDEIPLAGGAMTSGVVRVGDTVRRRAPERVRLMRHVLLHLERVGFAAAPRWLGVDDQGRDILSWIEGETFTDRSQMHPYIGDPPVRLTFSDEQVAAAMRLLRRYHDAFPADQVVVHGDFGPWNLVWRDGIPVAMIDFDNVYRGDPSEDVAYALRMFVGYGFADAAPAELSRRTRIAVAAYGRSFDVPAILAHEYDLAEERCLRNGWRRQLARLPVEREWLAENGHVLSDR
ncbi:MAG TPA: phosphotransferase [Gaiellaceae bacterium]|nr:phosphotransferase [Gaiellaceae bacterium]